MSYAFAARCNRYDALGYNLPTQMSELWVRVSFALSAATLAEIDFPDLIDHYSGDFIQIVADGLSEPDQLNLNESVYLANFGDGLNIWSGFGGDSGDVSGLTAGAWHVLDLHYQKGVQTDYWLDGVLLQTETSAVDTRFAGMVCVGQAFDTGGSVLTNAATIYIGYAKIGTSQGGSQIFCDSFIHGAPHGWHLTFGIPTVVTSPYAGDTDFACDAPAVISDSFTNQHRIPWRFVITTTRNSDGDPETAVLTFLDRLASDRTCDFALNHPAESSGTVPSDNPEINILHTDGEPFLSFNDRALFGFRREANSTVDPPWVPRFAGIIMQIEDTADSDRAVSHYTAYDPWQYLYRRPIRKANYKMPGQNGLSFTGVRGSNLAHDLLKRTHEFDGNCFIDFGQTEFYNGTIENTDHININLQQGMSVGEAWQQLTDTNSMDIILTPIWDPVNRPGLICELSIFVQAGFEQRDAIMAWDKPSRSLTGVSRLSDGEEMANVLQFYGGQGGRALLPRRDLPSIAKYGEFWDQQFYTGHSILPGIITLFAKAQLALRKRGKMTLTVDVAPERGPYLFHEYSIGDQVPVYASNKLRKEITTGITDLKRVYAIPVTIGDDQMERIDKLLLSDPDDIA